MHLPFCSVDEVSESLSDEFSASFDDELSKSLDDEFSESLDDELALSIVNMFVIERKLFDKRIYGPRNENVNSSAIPLVSSGGERRQLS
jgi:hypothetical protein